MTWIGVCHLKSLLTPCSPLDLLTTFEHVELVELKQLIIECRGALHSLEAELEARQNPGRMNNKLDKCLQKLKERAEITRQLRALTQSDEASLVEADPILKVLKSGHIDSSQTLGTRKCGEMYTQLLWLTSRVAGPAYALLLICGDTRRNVEQLSLNQRAILVKHIAQHDTSLSSHALEEKANEIGLCRTSVDLPIT